MKVKLSQIIDAVGGYKLGDFSASTAIGNQIGTLMYMAPEIYCGETFSANIDTYSLGLVMYELLRIPFLCENGSRGDFSSKQVALSRHLSGEPLPKIPSVSKSLQ